MCWMREGDYVGTIQWNLSTEDTGPGLASDPNQPSADWFQNSPCGSNPGLVWDWDLVVLKEFRVISGEGREDIPPTLLIQSLPSGPPYDFTNLIYIRDCNEYRF